MNNIVVKPPLLREAANKIRQHARTIQSSIDAVDADIKTLGPSNFEGQRADAIRSRYARLREQIYRFKPLMEAFGRELDETAVRFEAADRTNKQTGD